MSEGLKVFIMFVVLVPTPALLVFVLIVWQRCVCHPLWETFNRKEKLQFISETLKED